MLLGPKTIFGWTVSGCTKSKGSQSIVATSIELKHMDRYWEVDEENNNDLEAEICETNFKKYTKKDLNGKYIVAIPFLRRYNIRRLKESSNGSFHELRKNITKK